MADDLALNQDDQGQTYLDVPLATGKRTRVYWKKPTPPSPEDLAGLRKDMAAHGYEWSHAGEQYNVPLPSGGTKSVKWTRDAPPSAADLAAFIKHVDPAGYAARMAPPKATRPDYVPDETSTDPLVAAQQRKDDQMYDALHPQFGMPPALQLPSRSGTRIARDYAQKQAKQPGTDEWFQTQLIGKFGERLDDQHLSLATRYLRAVGGDAQTWLPFVEKLVSQGSYDFMRKKVAEHEALLAHENSHGVIGPADPNAKPATQEELDNAVAAEKFGRMDVHQLRKWVLAHAVPADYWKRQEFNRALPILRDKNMDELRDEIPGGHSWLGGHVAGLAEMLWGNTDGTGSPIGLPLGGSLALDAASNAQGLLQGATGSDPGISTNVNDALRSAANLAIWTEAPAKVLGTLGKGAGILAETRYLRPVAKPVVESVTKAVQAVGEHVTQPVINAVGNFVRSQGPVVAVEYAIRQGLSKRASQAMVDTLLSAATKEAVASKFGTTTAEERVANVLARTSSMDEQGIRDTMEAWRAKAQNWVDHQQAIHGLEATADDFFAKYGNSLLTGKGKMPPAWMLDEAPTIGPKAMGLEPAGAEPPPLPTTAPVDISQGGVASGVLNNELARALAPATVEDQVGLAARRGEISTPLAARAQSSEGAASNNIKEQPNAYEPRAAGEPGAANAGAETSAQSVLADWRRQLHQGDSGGGGGPASATGQRRGYQAVDSGSRKPGVKQVFEPSPEAAAAWSQAKHPDGTPKIQAPTVFELKATDAGAKRFHAALKTAREANPTGSSVTLFEPKEYRSMRTFLSQDGKSGFALHGDDIVSVFRHPDSPSGVAPALLQLAVDEGGRRLDAFDTALPSIYSRSGFRAVARLPWDEAYAPEGWNHRLYQGYNGGRPDVVFMTYEPHAAPYKAGDGKLVQTYDEGVAAQKAALENVSQHGVEPMGDRNLSATEAPGEPEAAPDYGEATQRAQQAAKDAGIKAKADSLIDGFLELFAPHMRGEGANKAMLALNRRGADLVRLRETATRLLGAAREKFMGMSADESRAFIHAIETGEHASIADDSLREIADQLRNFLDAKRDAVRALGTGKLETFNETYFPHAWQDPEKAEQVIGQLMSGKGSLEGSKNFLRRRTHLTFEDGINAGLVPVSENPVDLVLLKAQEMDKYVTAVRMVEDMHEMGVEPHFVRGDGPAPVGMKYVDDKLFRVFGNEVRIREAFDLGMRERLMQLAKDLGVDVETVKSIQGAKRGAWGSESASGVQRRFAGPNEVLAHEIVGHAVDRKFNARRFFFGSPDRDTLLTELRDLASKRHESQGDQVSAGFKAYTQTQTELIANLGHAIVFNRPLVDQVAPTAARYWDALVAQHPVLKQIAAIRPGLELGTAETSYRAPGSNLMGRWALPEDAATVFNTYLSPGLRDNKYQLVSTLYRHYIAANNNVNAGNLGASLFHFFTTLGNSMASEMALGLRDIGQGKLARGSGRVLKGLSPTVGIRDYRLGGQLQQAYLDLENALPEHADIVRHLVDAGGRAVPDSNHINQAGAALREAWAENHYGTVLAKALPALLQWTSKPLMEYWVPRIKMGSFAQMVAQDLERLGPEATDIQVRNVVTNAYTSVENRMGQLAYDRRFWNGVVRDTAMGGIRSVGWSWGTIDELGGGLADVYDTRSRLKAGGPALTHKAAFTAALPIMVGTWGAIYSYLRFGHGPESPLDLWYWRTGRKNADGSPERIQPPTYIKDVASYARDIDEGVSKDDLGALTRTVRNKVAPLPSLLWQLAANRDYFNTEISHEDDPFLARGLDKLKFLGTNMMPFTIQQQLKSLDEKGTLDVPAVGGFTRAPAWAGKSPALAQAGDYVGAERPVGGYTQAEAQRKHAKSLIEGHLRNGETQQAMDLMQKFRLTDDERQQLIDRSGKPKLVGLVDMLKSPAEALRVYELADAREQDLIRGLVQDKVQKAMDGDKLAPREKAELMSRWRLALGKN